MELEEITDKYRALKPQMRYGILVVLSLMPAIYLWTNSGDGLEERKDTAEAELATARSNFEAASQKVAELPALEAKLTEIEDELQKAREVLPDKIEIESILGAIGGLEKEFDVKLMKFTPGAEQAPANGLEYKELPVDIVMNGTFVNTMRFMDKLVHMPNLTHLRNIQFNASSNQSDDKKKADPGPRRVDSQAKLILFKGM